METKGQNNNDWSIYFLSYFNSADEIQDSEILPPDVNFLPVQNSSGIWLAYNETTEEESDERPAIVFEDYRGQLYNAVELSCYLSGLSSLIIFPDGLDDDSTEEYTTIINAIDSGNAWETYTILFKEPVNNVLKNLTVSPLISLITQAFN